MYLADYITHPLKLIRQYNRANLRPDLVAGITVGVILLPQSIAFALIAELPPEMGIYAASVGAIAAALWGSSNHVHTGPANTTSLLVASILVALIPRASQAYILAAGLLAVMVGIMQFVLGAARLGMLTHFVSHSVIVGFSAGAGILIGLQQLRPLLGLGAADSPNLLEGFLQTVQELPAAHLPSAIIGAGVILLILALRKVNPKLPATLISLGTVSFVVFLIGVERLGVRVIGDLPRGLPPLADLPVLDLGLIAALSTGALAVGALGLIQAAAISRSITSLTRQKLDSNQEFVGQGLANIAAGLFSGFPVSASFSRSVFNLQAGARTPLASVFSGLFLLAALPVLAPVTAVLPLAAVAGILVLAAASLVDQKEMARIWRGSREDALIMSATLLGTLLLRLDFAVLTGILLSFAIYIKNTSTPRVRAVVLDDHFQHFGEHPGKPHCPQLAVFEILGDLYFGAVHHVETTLQQHLARNPGQRFVLLRMQNVGQCDFSGIHLLESIVAQYREWGGDVYMVGVRQPVLQIMKSTGFYNLLGSDHYLRQGEAINHLFYRVIDPTICIYECNVRVFRECLSLARPDQSVELPELSVPGIQVHEVEPRQLWKQCREKPPPLIFDVREPREFRRGHIPQAQLLPLPRLLTEPQRLVKDQPVILVCRSGRRSFRAAQFLISHGYEQIRILRGGMLAWEREGLLEAVENEPT